MPDIDPEIITDRTGDLLRATWKRDFLAIELSRWLTKHNTTSAECRITTWAPGVPELVHFGTLTLTSTRSQSECAKECARAYRGPDWPWIIKRTCLLVLDRRRGADGKLYHLKDEPEEPARYLVRDLVPEFGVTEWYGASETLKSYTLLYLVECVGMGIPFLGCPTRQGRSLIVDYETDRPEYVRRFHTLARGMGWSEQDLPDIVYYRATAPLADCGPELARTCATEKIDGTIIVDSVGIGGAATVEAEPVNAAFRAVRMTGLPVQFIHHSPEDQLRPYGSSYHRNGARSLIEFRRAPSDDDSRVVHVGLFHRKNNNGPKHPALGARFTFTDNALRIEAIDPGVITEIAAGLPLTQRVTDLLKKGALPFEELAERLGISDKDRERKKFGASIRQLKHRGKIIDVTGGLLGLPSKQREPV